jgi:dynamin-binding protein
LAISTNRHNDDSEFVKAHDKFRNDFLCLQIVMRDVEHYTRHIKEYVEKFLACLSGIELFMRASTNQSPEIESKWTRFNVSMRDLGTIALDDHVSFFSLFRPLFFLIHR